MHCINWTGRIYEDMTPEQCFHSSQPLLPPPEGSWWNKHRKVSLKIVQMEGWDARGRTIQGNNPHRKGGFEKNRRKREKGTYNLIVKGIFFINIRTTHPRTTQGRILRWICVSYSNILSPFILKSEFYLVLQFAHKTHSLNKFIVLGLLG